MTPKPLVMVESPYAGDVETNLRYLHACMRDCIRRGEVPVASHKLYPGPLNDDDPEERRLGLVLGKHLMSHCDLVAIYEDLGVSQGMHLGIRNANELNLPMPRRRLGEDWQDQEIAL